MSRLKEKLQNLTVAETVTYAVAAFLAFVGVIAVVSTLIKGKEFNAKKFALDAQISQLSGQLSVDNATDGEETSDEAAPVVRGSAQALGTQVAAQQNRYIILTPDNPNMTDQSEALLAIQKQIEPSFADDSKWAAQSWYSPSHETQTGTANNYTWTFGNNYSFEGESLPVVWICRNNRADNALCAYATAVYDPQTKLFSGFSKKVTKIGAERQAAMDGTDSINATETETVADTTAESESAEDLWGDTVSDNSVSDNAVDNPADSAPESESTSEASESESQTEILDGTYMDNMQVTDDGQNASYPSDIPANFFQ